MSGSIEQRGGHWLDVYLAQNVWEGLLSFLEIGCGDGLRLQKAGSHGAQCFAVEGDARQREAARQLCPDAYIVAAIDDIPPHAFDLILISPLGDAGILQTCLYKLAAKGSFKLTTTLVAMASDAAEAREAAATMSLLRFGKVETAETGPYRAEGHGSDFAQFTQERYVPGTWSEIAAYEHLPRYQLACDMAQGARVLDFGCGSGYGSATLARVAAKVTGLDVSEDALTYARTIHRAANLEFIHDATFGASLPARCFDLITCFEVIEHLEVQSQDEMLIALRRLLAPNGRLVISTPNPRTTSLYGHNPYHLCELSRDEFIEKLKQHFCDLTILDQWVAASIVFQPEAAPKWAQLHDLTGDYIGSQTEPAIFVAVCGMEPVGELTATAYLDRTRDFVRTRIQSIEWRNQQLVERYDLQQAQREIGRLHLSLQEATAQLRSTTAEFEAVLADRAALQATYAASEVALEQSKSETAASEAKCLRTVLVLQESHQETEYVARKRDEFRDLTEALTGALADMEARATAEIAEVQTRRTVALGHELQVLTARLMLIEHSTSWRVAKRMMPLLGVARPVLRPPLAVLWRTLRHLRQRAVWPSRPAIRRLAFHRPLQTQPEQEAGPPRDLSLEISFDPVWNPFRRRYVLRRDPSFVSIPQSHELARPYMVRLLTEIDSSIRRPKLLHIIPNVHVGGSTQLVIDLVQHLSAELEHEVLTSSLWQGKPHEGLTTHLIPDPDPAMIGQVIDRISPDLVHFHYWGLTDDPWYHSVLASLKGRNIPTIQNINTPVAPLLDEIFQHYVFVSEYVRREFGGSLPVEAAVSVIHPGIEIQRFEGVDPAADREQAVGMVYRLESDKLTETAIDVFIEIVRRRPRTKVYIIGGGRFLEPYIARTEAANVRANFRFTGYVPYTALPGLYDKFSVFVAPVWKESFGQVAPFAMAKRQAVVGFKVGALAEILGSDATLGADIAETTAIVRALLDDRKRLRQLGDHNAARAREMFTVETMVERYRAVYATLIDMPGGTLPR
jgi:glycosyltransferase involved in cell wall biosynthesis/2-polyprenyl-3-methyl-5-hydroxy-6-metoxy-1,4-benzoquinol methylase